MTWFKVDDDLAFHRKVIAAGNAAMGLWVRAGSWCAQHLTDGFVPEEMVGILGTPAQRAKLIKAGLWIEVDGGCQFHEWNENGRQPTAKQVREKRERAAERQAKHRAAIYANGQVSEGSNGVTDASVTAGVTPLLTPAPTRPDPYSSPNGELPLPLPPPAAAGAAPPDPEPATQIRIAQNITCAYVERVPLSKFPAVLGIVRRALRADHQPDAVRDALLRLADEGRPVTVDALRVELEGLPPPHRLARPSRPNTDDKIRYLQSLKTGTGPTVPAHPPTYQALPPAPPRGDPA